MIFFRKISSPRFSSWITRCCCFCWAGLYFLCGLFERHPWKADEPYTFDISWNMARDHQWIIPYIGDTPFMEKPPFVYWLGALFIRLCPALAPYNAARIAVLLCMIIMLVGYCLALRVLYQEWATKKYSQAEWIGYGLLLLTGSAGLVEHVHKLTSDVGQLAGSVLALSALMWHVADKNPASTRNTVWQGVLLGVGTGIAFLSKGLLIPGLLLITYLSLLVLFRCARGGRGRLLAVTAVFSLLPFVIPWPLLLFHADSALFKEWFWVNNLGRFFGFTQLGGHDNPLVRRITSLLSLGMPYTPIFIGSVAVLCSAFIKQCRQSGVLTHARGLLLHKPATTVAVFYLLISIVILLASGSMRDIYLLPLLPTMAMLSLPLSRKWDQRFIKVNLALNGFWLVILTAIIIIAAQLYLIHSPKLLLMLWPRVIQQLPLPFVLPLSPFRILLALLVMGLWFKLLRHFAANLLLTWSLGFAATFCIGLSLLLPWVDAAHSFQAPFRTLQPLVANARCLATNGLGESELGMLHYYTDISGRRIFAGHSGNGDYGVLNPNIRQCDYLLVLYDAPDFIYVPPRQWVQIWSGKRAADSREFRLYHLTPGQDGVADLVSVQS